MMLGVFPFSFPFGLPAIQYQNEELGIITRYEEFAYNALFAVTANRERSCLSLPRKFDFKNSYAERMFDDIPQGLLEVNSMD